MSSALTTKIPLLLSIAPFPEGFQGDMDETFQQACILMDAYVEGNFLTGLILPPGSTLPTNDQGPIAMGGTWYFFDPNSGQYQPQTVPVKTSRNFARNPVYQVAQCGTAFTLATGVTKTYDCALARVTANSVLAISAAAGPPATPDNDAIGTSILYTVGPSIVATPATTDLFAHEHVFEGSDIAALQGQALSLAFSIYSNNPGTYSVYLTNGGRDHAYVATFAIPAANTWYRIKIQGIPAFPTAGTWYFTEGQTGLYVGVVMALGSQWQTTQTNTWLGNFAAGTSGNSNLLGVAANTMRITGIKLEASSSVTPFSAYSFGDDLEAVLRYYWTSFSYQSSTAGVAVPIFAPSNGVWKADFVFPRRMCKVPTITPFSQATHATGLITNLSLATDIIPPGTPPTIAAAQKGLDDRQTCTIVITGCTIAGGVNVTAMSSTANLVVGMPVAGSGVPAPTTIAAIVSGTAITLSQAATNATNVTLTFSQTAHGDLLEAFITADARLS